MQRKRLKKFSKFFARLRSIWAFFLLLPYQEILSTAGKFFQSVWIFEFQSAFYDLLKSFAILFRACCLNFPCFVKKNLFPACSLNFLLHKNHCDHHWLNSSTESLTSVASSSTARPPAGRKRGNLTSTFLVQSVWTKIEFSSDEGAKAEDWWFTKLSDMFSFSSSSVDSIWHSKGFRGDSYLQKTPSLATVAKSRERPWLLLSVSNWIRIKKYIKSIFPIEILYKLTWVFCSSVCRILRIIEIIKIEYNSRVKILQEIKFRFDWLSSIHTMFFSSVASVAVPVLITQFVVQSNLKSTLYSFFLKLVRLYERLL